MSSFVRLAYLAITLNWFLEPLAHGQIAPPSNRMYHPAEDKAYLQEIGEKIPTTQPVTAVAVFQGTIYAVIGGRLHTLTDGKLAHDARGPDAIERLISLGD